jgi:hypothetical protein
MIHLKKQSLNEITVTLKERQTLENPFFLFVFTHEQTENQYSVILEDTSSFSYRANTFFLTLPDDLDIIDEGDFKYQIFEQTDEDNLDPDEADNLLEQGKMRLKATPSEEYFYSPN